MTFNDNIQQKVILPFAELYELYISDIPVKLTSYYQDVFDDILGTFKATTMQRNEFQITSKQESTTLTLTIAVNEDISQLLLHTLLVPFKIKIHRYFLHDKTYKTIFVGYATAVLSSSNVITLQISSLIGRGDKHVPILHYQKQCNNSLFDLRCQVNKSIHSTQVNLYNITIVSSTEFVINEAGNFPNNYFKNGIFVVESDFRMVVEQIGNKINIQYPFDYDIRTKTNARLYAGCNKTIDDCRNKFNNEKNFLGFPYIPTSNPVIWGL